MGTKVTVDNITNVDNSSGVATMNDNFDVVADEFDKAHYRDGSLAATGDWDMDSNRILNLPEAVNNTEPVTLKQFGNLNATAEALISKSYDSIAEGLANTTNGEAFAVDNGDGTSTIYINDNGVADEQRTLATTAALISPSGANLVGTPVGPLSNQMLANKTALAALSPSNGDKARIANDGEWLFDASDLSSEVAADTAGGIYVAPDGAPTGVSGAWVRQFNGPVEIEWFGAAGDGVTDDTGAYTAACAVADILDKSVQIGPDKIIQIATGEQPLPSRGFTGGGEIRGASYTYGYNGVPTTTIKGSGSYDAPISITSPTQGDTTITVANSYSQGDVLLVRDATGNDANNRMELAVVRSSNGSQIVLQSPLKYTYGSTATVRKMNARGPYSDGGCRFRDMIVDLERYDGVSITGDYIATRVYHSETINIAAKPSLFDGMGSNVWFGLSNCCRLFNVSGHFQNIDSTDTQGHVKLNCGIHDGNIDITVSGSLGTVDAQNGIHIDTYFLNNTRIDSDWLACSNIRARCNASGVDRSIFVACNPTLTAGAQNQSWNIDVEGGGSSIAVQRVKDSRITALTPTTTISLFATTDSTVNCFSRPGIFTLSAQSVSNLDINFQVKPTLTLRGQTSAGTGTYTINRGRTVYRGGWAEMTVKIVWSAHTGTGNMLIDAIDVTPINNANNAVCQLVYTDVPNVARLEFSSTQNAGTATPTNIFQLRETSGAGGGLADVTASGTLEFTVKWAVLLFGTT